MSGRSPGARAVRTGVTGSPFLTQIGLLPDRVRHGGHTFTLPPFEFGLELKLASPITFLVGGDFMDGALSGRTRQFSA